ncbi:MAG: OmpA family protein [Rhizomicrobium sp.]
MRYTPISLLLMAAPLLLATGAYGDPVYNNPEVVTNPAPGAGVLLYPGGHYGRIVQGDLIQPGEGDAPIRLHRISKKPAARSVRESLVSPAAPVVHKTRVAVAPPPDLVPPVAAPERKVAKKQPENSVVRPVETPVARSLPPPVAKPPVKVASRQAQPVNRAASAGSFDMGDLEVAHGGHAAARPPSAVQNTPPAKPPVQVARLEPQHPVAEARGARRGSITFEANASDPGGAAVQSLTRLADSLSMALAGNGSGRVQVFAYAGPKGEKSSDSRRLSLKRALIVRQLLIDAGVPSDRIDVRAMGGATDGGAAERVDVFLK